MHVGVGVGVAPRASVARSESALLSLLFITVMVAAEAWRQNEADTRSAMSLRERFIGVRGS